MCLETVTRPETGLENSTTSLDNPLYIYCAKGQEKSHIYCVVCGFRANVRYVFLRGMTESLISGRMDVENSISTVIFQILTCLTFYPQFRRFCALLF